MGSVNIYTKRWLIAGCLLILGIQTVVQIRLASLDSQTTDEAVHLSAGYTYLTRGDWHFNPEHPPLVKILAALPLLALKPNISPAAEGLWRKSDNFFYDSWQENRRFGEIMLYESGNNPDQLLFWARMPMVLITLLLGLAIFLIALRHWGPISAIVAVALYAFNPSINGHGHLITTDMALALGFLLTVYFFWQFLEKPTWRYSAFFGLSLALALLTKHTAIILLPILGILAIICWFDKSRQTSWRDTLIKFVVSLVVVWALIWTGFGWHDRVVPQTESISTQIRVANTPSKIGQANLTADNLYKIIRPIFSLLPGDYAKGLFMVIGHASGGHTTYLLGQTSKTGWWYYFPILILLKNPLAELLVVGGTIYLLVLKRHRDRLVMALAVGAGLFLAVAMLSKANLGIRHVMPILPLLFIAGGWAASVHRKFFWVTVGLLVWLALVFSLSFPSYLGYFNEFAGGSNNGYTIATDSNLDWGQDLKRIQHYIQQNQLTNVYIEYNWLGRSALDYYLGRNNYRLLSDWQVGQPGYAIIGASAYSQDDYPFLYNCPDRRLITNAVFVCPLNN